jgi:hypothetical protein
MSDFSFTGRVGFRSSLPDARGPPGEATILSLNPRRADGIRSATGWSQVEPGSLNLEVGNEVVPALHKLTPTWTEDGSTVIYPPGLEHIPKKRGAYFYFLAQAHAKGKTEQVLVRTSRNPLPRRVELFAPISLKVVFELVMADPVEVVVHAI